MFPFLLFFIYIFFLLYFFRVVADLKGREMFLSGAGTGFPFMSVFDIRDMLRP